MAQPNTYPQRQYSKDLGRSPKSPKFSKSSPAVEETSSTKHHLPKVHIPFRHHEQSQIPIPSSETPSSQRPATLARTSSIQTRYMNMLLALDTIPRLHNILASFFTWILLAGFVIFPGTFTSVQHLTDSDSTLTDKTASQILDSVNHVPLLVIAGTCCGIGAIGMIWLWWRWRENFVWLLNKLFLPACLNCLAGLITTVVNVYSQQGGTWSITARVTGIVAGVSMMILALLFAVYNFWVLKRVKSSHEREMDGGYEGEGLAEKIERVAKEPALEPGSVV